MIVGDDRHKVANSVMAAGLAVFRAKRFRFQIPSVDVLSPASTCRRHLLRRRRDGLQLPL